MLRGLPAAKEWFRTVAERPCVPGFVAIELVAGCRDGRELQSIRKFLKPLQIVWASEDDMNRALTDYAPFFLSHGLGGFDALIAATATGQGATLHTFNASNYSGIFSPIRH